MPDSTPAGSPLEANANPTKDFFISMLVRDIDLMPAISDLVDNAVDGANRLRGKASYSDLWVRIRIAPDAFRIADNCGGIPLDLARDYAFRFGRPEGMVPTPHSIGQFGVGMKRALFKLGRHFTVTSATHDTRFTMDVDVDTWRDAPDWVFPLQAEEGLSVPPDEQGTIIAVTSVHPGVARDFELEEFESGLRVELARRHQGATENGLVLTLNDVPLQVDVAGLLHSDALKPAFDKISFNGDGQAVVAQIWAGIADSSPRDAGWYVFGNGRLIVGPDQTAVTGWGAGDEHTIPKYHNEFARFRGYVFFDSDDASRLPWNTTKTGLDLDSDVYRRTRQRMLTLMRPVIDFLYRLDDERTHSDEHGPLGTLVEQAETYLFTAPNNDRP